MIAPKSSIIARAMSNIFKLTGTLLPNKDATPNENAISVAVGIPQPCVNAVPELNKRKIRAGTTIPPNAAPKGNTAFLKDESSPLTNSLLISIPASRKKKDIRKLLIHLAKVSGKCNAEEKSGAFQKSLYQLLLPRFVISREQSVHRIRITPVARLSLIKKRSGLIAFLIICLIYFALKLLIRIADYCHAYAGFSAGTGTPLPDK
jgi:hypothetical protein